MSSRSTRDFTFRRLSAPPVGRPVLPVSVRGRPTASFLQWEFGSDHLLEVRFTEKQKQEYQ